MNYTNTLIELLLFALGLSLVINAAHLAFQKEMALNWLYKWLESKFRAKKLKDLDWSKVYCDNRASHRYITYENGIYKKTVTFKAHLHSKGDNEIEKIGYWVKNYTERLSEDQYSHSKNRNSEGLLYAAKPIYACASCMPSLWSLPLLSILVWWKVFFIAIFAVVISTLINDKLFE